jgi:Cytidylate kinase-like family
VTISASFGAGGSRVAPVVAERLGVEVLDRAIPARVAERLAVPLDDALAHDEALGDAIGRLASSFALLPELAGALVQAGVLAGEDYRRETERIIVEHAGDGEVVLGRAGALVLREHPDALHVRLDGPPEQRLAAAVYRSGRPEDEVRRDLETNDRTRESYVRHFYRCDPTDARHYHLVVDSTALPLDVVVDLVVRAARARGIGPR